jgi:CubicO group peptidase (beta-lactamase class C family)
MAVKDGLIESWDDKAQKYAPQYKGSAFGESSLASLMVMASGVKFDEDYASDTSDINPFFFDSFILQKDPDSLLLKFSQSRPEFNDFQYISPNSHVLSAVLRGVYQKPLVEIIQKQIWEPLGMANDANWLQHKDDDDGQALGYCCLNATLKDYARFGLFHLEAQQGEGLGVEELPSDWISKLPVPASDKHVKGGDNYSGRGYSWHFWLPPNRDGVFFAAGVYGQFIWIEPARNLVIVRNSSDPAWTPRFLESEATLMAISDFFANE